MIRSASHQVYIFPGKIQQLEDLFSLQIKPDFSLTVDARIAKLTDQPMHTMGVWETVGSA
jgi:hypothetical protein